MFQFHLSKTDTLLKGWICSLSSSSALAPPSYVDSGHRLAFAWVLAAVLTLSFWSTVWSEFYAVPSAIITFFLPSFSSYLVQCLRIQMWRPVSKESPCGQARWPKFECRTPRVEGENQTPTSCPPLAWLPSEQLQIQVRLRSMLLLNKRQ